MPTGKEKKISEIPAWEVEIHFKGPKKQDFKKRVWEFRLETDCIIIIYYDRFDGFGGPHRNIEVFPIAELTFAICKEIDRKEPPRIITPDAIIDTKRSQPAVN